MKSSFLRDLGVFGYDPVEPIILAALVTEDPLLLVGHAGTGKTFLLNSLSEALGLEHRHYNASLVSFDDLVGFPYPQPDGSGIRYLETPATIWKAESVLVDEINRCKPEHQNRFFSIVHERRIQGLPIEKLRYRWAAMNPPGVDTDGYSGTEPLDAALADRFAFVIKVVDWNELSDDDQRSVADPRGDGAISDDGGRLKNFIHEAREKFKAFLHNPCPQVIEYARGAAITLNEAGLRISPRRVRQLARNLIAVDIVSPKYRDRRFELSLRWSLPQRATGQPLDDALIVAAHHSAWAAVGLDGVDKWLHDFSLEKNLSAKTKLLLNTCPDPDTGTIAVTQLIANESADRALAFALALFPLSLHHPGLPIGVEGVNEFGRIAGDAMDVEFSRKWYSRDSKGSHQNKEQREHPDYSRLAAVFRAFKGGRRERAEQLFSALFARGLIPANPEALESEFNDCIAEAQRFLKVRK
jgi:MoxR-like ATPase